MMKWNTKDQKLFPNMRALELPAVACLFWRMARGSESDVKHCPDDEILLVPSRCNDTKVRNWLMNRTL
jgi:hypothetical protein